MARVHRDSARTKLDRPTARERVNRSFGCGVKRSIQSGEPRSRRRNVNDPPIPRFGSANKFPRRNDQGSDIHCEDALNLLQLHTFQSVPAKNSSIINQYIEAFCPLCLNVRTARPPNLVPSSSPREIRLCHPCSEFHQQPSSRPLCFYSRGQRLRLRALPACVRSRRQFRVMIRLPVQFDPEDCSPKILEQSQRMTRDNAGR